MVSWEALMITIPSEKQTGCRHCCITYDPYKLGTHKIHTWWGFPKPVWDPLGQFGILQACLGSPKFVDDPLTPLEPQFRFWGQTSQIARSFPHNNGTAVLKGLSLLGIA